MKTTSMETVSTGVPDKNKEHHLRSKDKAEKSYDALRHIQLHLSEIQKKRFTIHYVKPTAQLVQFLNKKMQIFKIQISDQSSPHQSLYCNWYIHGTSGTMRDLSLAICSPLAAATTLIARFMWPTWGPSAADRTQMGPMLVPWTLLSGVRAEVSHYYFCVS